MGPELAQAFTDGSWGFGGHGTIGNAQFSPITVGGTVFPHGLGTQPPSNGAARVLERLVPAGMKPHIHLTITDDGGMAQAFVIIEALPKRQDA